MTRQQALSRFLSLVRQGITTEVRARAWVWMALTMVLAAAIITLIPVPFWTATVSLRAVIGSNIAIIAITVAVLSSYNLTAVRQAAGMISGPVASSSLALSRIAVGAALAVLAVLVQAALFALVPSAEASAVLDFLWTAALIALWIVAVLVPWALLSRLALGRAAAPWAMLALVLVAAWVPTVGSPPFTVASRFLPMIPEDSASDVLADPRSWLYVLAHAAAVTLATAPLIGRSGQS